MPCGRGLGPLKPFVFGKFLNQETLGNKLSVVRFCVPEEIPTLFSEVDSVYNGGSFQGVGPHEDDGFLTYPIQ